jgi:hypothetical protein
VDDRLAGRGVCRSEPGTEFVFSIESAGVVEVTGSTETADGPVAPALELRAR